MKNYVLCEDGSHISAVGLDGKEIAGAYQPEGYNYWQLYVCQCVRELTGLRTPPHREHFWGEHGRVDSKAWVEVIAALYVLATNQSTAVVA